MLRTTSLSSSYGFNVYPRLLSAALLGDYYILTDLIFHLEEEEGFEPSDAHHIV